MATSWLPLIMLSGSLCRWSLYSTRTYLRYFYFIVGIYHARTMNVVMAPNIYEDQVEWPCLIVMHPSRRVCKRTWCLTSPVDEEKGSMVD